MAAKGCAILKQKSQPLGRKRLEGMHLPPRGTNTRRQWPNPQGVLASLVGLGANVSFTGPPPSFHLKPARRFVPRLILLLLAAR